MRASRLLTILMILQSRDLVSAAELARDCQVSVRSIYRDIDSLSALGIPVYSEQGVNGGYRLLEGYRTQLNGFSKQEIETLFMLGLSGPMQELGLAPAMSEARLKLLAAIPVSLRTHAERFQSSFLLDTPSWFTEKETVGDLPQLFNAIWQKNQIKFDYQSWRGSSQRVVNPLGMVLKAGTWYLVAQSEGQFKTYRVARIQDLKILNHSFESPMPFDLSAYWQQSNRQMEAELYPNTAEIKLTAKGLKMLSSLSPPYVRQHTQIGQTNETGWTSVTLPSGKTEQAVVEMLRFGPEVQVVRPEALRQAMKDVIEEMVRYYSQPRTD
ncbi:WYL domain-containing protein [Photobacterium halotolerans]|uniref:WYL domain-containing protein n=1 Tax=Photobacterium halotolerans TaxID=265726 RepID=A0A7X4Y0V0_9GAMM|nr:YafY family protein [Photobacterium halotolerans]NAW66601.1 WYL domain-containing protein [Photobacterium halotolerans]NAX48867.1 WYL domain-containing protein [Photobacterium halotolerans]